MTVYGNYDVIAFKSCIQIFTVYTANIYDQITMELQPFSVVVRRFTGDTNYSAKYGSFLYETVKLRIN